MGDVSENEKDEKTVTKKVKLIIAQMNREKIYSLDKVKHNSIPNFNNSKYKDVLKPIQKSEWTVSLPTPIFTSISSDTLDFDPCHKRTKQLRNYLNVIQYLPHSYKRSQDKLIRKARNRGIYPYSAVKFTEMLEQNPDAYFEGIYDWYYTGGNLEVFQYQNENYVYHATGSDLEDLNVSKVDYSSGQIKLSHILRKRLQAIIKDYANPEILEIQNLNNSRVLIRRRSYISLYAFETNNLKHCYHLSNGSVPFISSTKASQSDDELITSDLKKTVVLWDLNVSAENPKQHLFTSIDGPEKSKNWNCVRYLDENVSVLADLHNFYLLDSRQSAEQNKMAYGLHSAIEACELNSIVAPSRFSDLIYFGSTHKLVAVDRRFLASTGHKHVMQKWTHQMNSSPLMLRTMMRNNVEMLLMSSYRNGDVRICENNRISIQPSDRIYDSARLPLKPPSLADAYRRARCEGLCIDPYAGISHRLNYSHTGLGFLQNHDIESILLASSNGDIISQMLIGQSEEEMINENNLAAMTCWEDILRKRSQIPLNVTSVENLEPLRKVFHCDRLDFEDDTAEDTIDENYKIRRGRWQRPMKSLRQYKDALAADILSIWDIEDEPIEGERNLVLPSEDATGSMLDQWLEKSTVTEADTSILNAIDVNEESFLNRTAETTTQSAIPQSSKKTTKKPVKRNYVKGF